MKNMPAQNTVSNFRPSGAMKTMAILVALAFVAILWPAAAQAQLYWDGPNTTNNSALDGGSGNWDHTLTYWTTSSGDTVAHQAWTDGNLAVFQSTAGGGTITLTDDTNAVVATGLTFNTSGFNITDDGTGGFLQLDGATTITVNPGISATITTSINSVFSSSTLTINGGGTLNIAGFNAGTYFGQTITISGGTTVVAQVNAGVGTGDFALPSNSLFNLVAGTLDVNGTNQSIAALIGAAGSIVTNTSATYGSITIGANAVTSGTYAGNITDTAAGIETTALLTPAGGLGLTIVAPNGGYTLKLTGANTYHGITTVGSSLTGNAAVLQAGAVNTFSPNSVVDVKGGATLDLNGFSQTTAGLDGTGTGKITNTAASTTATLTIGNASLTGTLLSDVNLVDTGSGILALTKNGTYSQVLAGNNTYSGATTVSAGALAAGSATGFSSNSAYTVAAAGTLDINGYNTTVGSLSGTGSVTNGSGTVTGPHIGNATLSTGGNGASATFGGAITDGLSGALALTKVGAGTQVLTGANTYTGNTTVNGGLLQVDGSTTSVSTTVNAGGTLGGIGTIGGSVTNGGNVAPGDSPGTLTIAGSYTQTAAGTLTIQIAGLAAGQHDLLAVGAGAILNGKLQLVRLNNFTMHPGDAVTILTTATGTVAGTFSTVDTGTILNAKVVYDLQDVMVIYGQGTFSTLPGLTPNQLVIANAIDAVFADSRETALLNFLNNEPLGNLQHDLDLMSPEQLTAIFGISFSYADIQGSNIENHLAQIRAVDEPQANVGVSVRASAGLRKDEDDKKSVAAPTPEQSRWNVFMEGSGNFVRVNSDFNAAGYNFTTGGVTVGVDYRACPHFTIGIMGGYADTGATSAQGGSVDVNSGRVGIYSTVYGGGLYMNTLVAGGYNSYDTHRTGLGGIAQGNTDGEEFDGLVSGGYDIHAGNYTFGPIAAAQYTYVGINNYSEAGSLAPLNIPSQNQQSFRTKIGVKASSIWHIGGFAVSPLVSVAWQHEFLDTAYALDSSFASGAGGVFTVHGPALGRDSVVVNAGADIQWTERFATYIYYNGELGRKNYQLNSVSGGARVSF